jgi:hypothetical protein
MNTIEDFMHRLPNDVGGQPAPAFERVEHELRPWEKRCHALADVLDFHKIINARGLCGDLVSERCADSHPACPEDARDRGTNRRGPSRWVDG